MSHGDTSHAGLDILGAFFPLSVSNPLCNVWDAYTPNAYFRDVLVDLSMQSA